MCDWRCNSSPISARPGKARGMADQPGGRGGRDDRPSISTRLEALRTKREQERNREGDLQRCISFADGDKPGAKPEATRRGLGETSRRQGEAHE
jgi:hypothetical protein